ncbi:plasmalemma vesicle associated protein b [Stegostoma tigrinum]|uniref:plasmalemma vesicle associated protein b n=1 Tax=Stegostoma tigrinum TaxID=3053191 RepID=UPI00202B8C7B|nr:plasmalemma vesicle associated protein b [Stegostoma tigrinum]
MGFFEKPGSVRSLDMDHNSYPMKKLGYDSRDYQKSKSSSCDYYVKYFLLCTSIIQLLIILGLVLFMVYGNNQKTQQSRLETSRNQSVKFIGDINDLHTKINRQDKEIKRCYSMFSNATSDLMKINATLMACSQKNNTKQQPGLLPGPYHPFLANPFDMWRTYKVLKINYSIIQTQLEKMKADCELQQAKHNLEMTKLNSQISKLSRQLTDQRGNCTAISKDFKKMVEETRMVYAEGFRKIVEKVVEHYDPNLSRQLEQMTANCTPLASNFQMQLQQRIDNFVTNFKHIWQNNNVQSSRISNLEKKNEECQQEAAAQLYQFKTKESQMQREKENYLEEKVKFLEELNQLKIQLAAVNTNFLLNPGSSSTKPISCQNELTSIANELWSLRKEKSTLEYYKTDLEDKLATLKKQLEICYLSEQQARLGCRMAG